MFCTTTGALYSGTKFNVSYVFLLGSRRMNMKVNGARRSVLMTCCCPSLPQEHHEPVLCRLVFIFLIRIFFSLYVYGGTDCSVHSLCNAIAKWGYLGHCDIHWINCCTCCMLTGAAEVWHRPCVGHLPSRSHPGGLDSRDMRQFQYEAAWRNGRWEQSTPTRYIDSL